MIKLVDQLSPMGNFAVATATDIVCSDNERLQDKIDNGTLGGDTSQTLTESEFLALPEEQKLNNSYYLYDIGVHYKNGVAYSRKKPIQLTMEEYKALGEVDPDQEYIVSADAEGILLEASDIGYSNAVSNLPCTTVQGAIDELNSNLGGLSDNIDAFKNVQIVSALGSTKLKEIIQSEFPKLKNGRGMIKISDGTTLYCGTYIKYSNTQGSTTFTNVEGTSYIWTIRGDTVTLQELATTDNIFKNITINVEEGSDYNISKIVGSDISDIITMVGFGSVSSYDFCIVDARPENFVIRILKGSGDVRINYRLA